ncbi:NADH-quinone oxidoreductase subunit C [bacterium]|nr:NADH-quinone oxidoreductase subunit C [bacterium]
MTQKEIIEKIKNNFQKVDIKILDDHQFSVGIKKEQNISVLAFLQLLGFKELALLTAVDWIDDGEFEIVYNLFSYSDNQQILVKTRIKRDNLDIQSVVNLWETAEMYERDTHEFFGVNFIGNDKLMPLFLHNWLDIPPMRKDFDSLAYSNEVYGKFKEERDK